ncbi:hypothetical protein MMC28_006392 [Mycoblastus sanguinarius]|nr:hypothetical protein [Mycoblastus sanguinarius]
MASPSSRAAAGVPPMPQRARRIPDEEWEVWREKLVKLFLEGDVPRKKIVAIMAEKHHFVITEVQLKNRFKKWDVKKYIPDDDLRIMLSLKRNRQIFGKDARFQYKGHDVEQERIERAWKRQRRPLRSPEFVPPYIKMYNSRQHSPQNALYGTSLSSASHHAMVLQNFNMPSLEPYQTRGSPSVASHDTFDCDFDFNFDTPQAVREHCNHTVTDAGQFRSDLVMAEAPVTAPLRSEETDFWGDVIPSTEMQVEHSGISRILQDDEHLSTTQTGEDILAFSQAGVPHLERPLWLLDHLAIRHDH